MKPLDDMLPEEQDPQNRELITFLRQVNLSPFAVDPTKRTEVLSRARRRLLQLDPESSFAEETLAPVTRELASLLSRPDARKDTRYRSMRLKLLLNVFAAVLVVVALIGTSFLIFGSWPPFQSDRSGTAPSIGPVGASVKIYTGTINGFEMSMKITPGPYFLNELLEVDLSITNHSHTSYWLFSSSGLCSGLLKIVTEGGRSPFVTDIQRNWTGLGQLSETLLKCNVPFSNFPTGLRLPATQTITVKQYVQLTSSGHVTLIAHVAFTQTTAVFGYPDPHAVSTEAPLTSLHLLVNSRVPSDRALSVKEQRVEKVIINLPPSAHDHLLYETEYVCDQGASSGERKVDIRISLPTLTLQTPQWCGTNSKGILFVYFAGVPGYTIVSGRLSS